MANDEEPESIDLDQWNSANVELAEKMMLDASLKHTSLNSEPVDKFSSWALAGVAASAALIVVNIASIIPHFSTEGVRLILSALAASALMGIISKFHAIRCQVHVRTMIGIENDLPDILEQYYANVSEIQAGANTEYKEIEMPRVVSGYYSSVSGVAGWILKRKLKKEEINMEVSQYTVSAKQFFRQTNCLIWQMMIMFAAICIAVYFSRSVGMLAQ